MPIGTVAKSEQMRRCGTRIVAATRAVLAFLTVSTFLREYYAGTPVVCTVCVEYD